MKITDEVRKFAAEQENLRGGSARSRIKRKSEEFVARARALPLTHNLAFGFQIMTKRTLNVHFDEARTNKD
jgi:hypothetical protein